MKYLSLFSGIGGFEIGINKALQDLYGTEQPEYEAENPNNPQGGVVPVNEAQRLGNPVCVGYSEIDPYADAIYKYNFGGTNASDCYKQLTQIEQDRQRGDGNFNKTGTDVLLTSRTTTLCNEHGGNLGDCTKINPKELPDFDLLVGGFPCQAFSIAGKRGGFEDTRGTLIFDVLRILKEKQPRHFILENVKGLLSHDSGNTFKTIITSLAELGYAVEWQVLNAKNFGVPQNRERVFIVGHLGGFGGREVFPITGQGNKYTTESKSAETAVARTLTGGGHSGGNHSGMTIINKTVRSGGRGSLTAKHNWDTHNIDGKIRRLTPKECERLMGLPDDWTKYGIYDGWQSGLMRVDGDNSRLKAESGQKTTDSIRSNRIPSTIKEMSDTRRYKACGNGVVTNVVEEVVRRLYG